MMEVHLLLYTIVTLELTKTHHTGVWLDNRNTSKTCVIHVILFIVVM